MELQERLRFSVYFVLLTCFSFSASSASFNDNAVWEFACNIKHAPGYPAGNAPKKLRKVKVIWFRDDGYAKLLYSNGNGKELREIPGFADSNQHTAHFWMSPATAKFTGKETKDSKYGGWVEAFGPTMVSLRSSGQIAITTHDIIYGGMKPFSEVGTCKITGQNALSE